MTKKAKQVRVYWTPEETVQVLASMLDYGAYAPGTTTTTLIRKGQEVLPTNRQRPGPISGNVLVKLGDMYRAYREGQPIPGFGRGLGSKYWDDARIREELTRLRTRTAILPDDEPGKAVAVFDAAMAKMQNESLAAAQKAYEDETELEEFHNIFGEDGSHMTAEGAEEVAARMRATVENIAEEEEAEPEATPEERFLTALSDLLASRVPPPSEEEPAVSNVQVDLRPLLKQMGEVIANQNRMAHIMEQVLAASQETTRLAIEAASVPTYEKVLKLSRMKQGVLPVSKDPDTLDDLETMDDDHGPDDVNGNLIDSEPTRRMAHKPEKLTIAVYGLLDAHHGQIKREFGHHFNLKFYASKSQKDTYVGGAQKAFVMASFTKKDVAEELAKTLKPEDVHIIGGKTSYLITEMRKVLAEQRFPHVAPMTPYYQRGN